MTMTDGAAPALVEEAVLTDLQARLTAFHPVQLPPGRGWDLGMDAGFLDTLVGYWKESYRWREHESRIRALPWVVTGEGGPTPVRSVHQRAANSAAMPVLLLHGWPDSVLRFERVLPLLSDVHVVVPALPGYPFAAPVEEVGLSTSAMAHAVASVMTDLGYDRYVVSAGDIGCDLAEVLAADYPERVAALHLVDVSQNHFTVAGPPANLTAAEQDYVNRGLEWQRTEGGYGHEQSTKPHTLAVGLGDSPAGLAAWITEKLRAWSDCNGDVEAVFPRDDLLTWVTAYWVSGAIGSSFTPYTGRTKPVERFTPPTVFSMSPRDLLNAPRSFAERFYDVQGWIEQPAGGHFAAWEQPAAYVLALQAAVSAAGQQASTA